MDTARVEELKKIANRVRKDIITQVYSASSGHPGGSLSIADVLTYLYFEKMNVKVDDPKWEDRDRFVLSKGHASPALYAVLAEKGFFPVEELKNFRNIGSFLQGHPDMKHTPGVDMSSGSLGLGVSAACGMALGAKAQGKSYRVYCALGDGEIAEGQVWEAAMLAAHYKLDNLCIFVDRNGLQIDGETKKVMNSDPLDEKYAAFGWNVQVINGHDFEAIHKACENAEACKGKPSVIIVDTVKGKGVSYMENKASWHGAAPNAEQYEQAMADLDAIV